MATQTAVKLSPDLTMGQIAQADERASQLLLSIGLDVSDLEDKTLREICFKKQWDEEEIVRWITKHREAETDRKPNEATNIWEDPYRLSNHLESKLAVQNSRMLTSVSSRMNEVCKIHGIQYPWLKDVHFTLYKLEEKLPLFLQFERERLFPQVRKLYRSGKNINAGLLMDLERSVSIIESDHQKIRKWMEKIRSLSNNFAVPGHVCSSFEILQQDFKTLFDGLEEQMSLTDNYLLPWVKKRVGQELSG
jgi:regulator of cell morphogenesis and NO signaling